MFVVMHNVVVVTMERKEDVVMNVQECQTVHGKFNKFFFFFFFLRQGKPRLFVVVVVVVVVDTVLLTTY